jgi:UDP-3-O-[3-hydroxymyristoyl] glucosamine N-acyltransferase
LKNIKKISFLAIENFLNKNNVKFISNIDHSEYFNSLNSLSNSKKNDLIFFTDIYHKDKLKISNAKACLINNSHLKYLPNHIEPIIVDDAYKSFAILSNLFTPIIQSNGIISKYSSIDKSIAIKKNVQIDPFVIIRENCLIDDNVIIQSNSTIGPNVIIGKNTVIHSNTSLQECTIGSNCIIKSGAVIGGTGFGFDPQSKIRINHIGNVIIKDNCNIGSNTTIDRAVFDSTIIGSNSFIDNLVQIAHNVLLGKGAIIASQTGIAGSSVIGENVIIGGKAGISGHISIGKNVTIAAKSGVTKSIKDNSVVAGFPAIDIRKWKKINIKLNKLL